MSDFPILGFASHMSPAEREMREETAMREDFRERFAPINNATESALKRVEDEADNDWLWNGRDQPDEHEWARPSGPEEC